MKNYSNRFETPRVSSAEKLRQTHIMCVLGRLAGMIRPVIWLVCVDLITAFGTLRALDL